MSFDGRRRRQRVDVRACVRIRSSWRCTEAEQQQQQQPSSAVSSLGCRATGRPAAVGCIRRPKVVLRDACAHRFLRVRTLVTRHSCACVCVRI